MLKSNDDGGESLHLRGDWLLTVMVSKRFCFRWLIQQQITHKTKARQTEKMTTASNNNELLYIWHLPPIGCGNPLNVTRLLSPWMETSIEEQFTYIWKPKKKIDMMADSLKFVFGMRGYNSIEPMSQSILALDLIDSLLSWYEMTY